MFPQVGVREGAGAAQGPMPLPSWENEQPGTDRQTVGSKGGGARAFGGRSVRGLVCPKHPQHRLPGANLFLSPSTGKSWAQSTAMLWIPQPPSQRGDNHLLSHQFVPFSCFCSLVTFYILPSDAGFPNSVSCGVLSKASGQSR